MGLWSHDYVCCALPLYNVGIYSMLAETFVVAITTGVLCFATPKIIAVYIPGAGPYLLGVICIVLAVVQGWGLWTVYKEKPRQYRLFVRTSIALTALGLLLSLIWIIISFANHSNAVSACLAQFVAPGQDVSSASGETLCNIFTWVQCGLLLFMWFFVGLSQAYFLNMMRIYGFEQRRDHAKYNSVYSNMGEEIALRNSFDQTRKESPFGGHDRTESNSTKTSGLRNEIMAVEDKRFAGGGARYLDPYEIHSSPTRHRPASVHGTAASANSRSIQMIQSSRGHRHQNTQPSYPPYASTGGAYSDPVSAPRGPRQQMYARQM